MVEGTSSEFLRGKDQEQLIDSGKLTRGKKQFLRN